MTRFVLCALIVAVAACGGSGSSSADSPASTGAVQPVTCPSSVSFTVTTSNFMFSPMTTDIPLGEIVQFVLPGAHNVRPGHVPSDGTTADANLTVDFSQTKCFKFTQSGMYGFHCMPHSFNGTIMVH